MTTTMIAEYRGYEIQWRDHGLSFDIYKDGMKVNDSIKTIELCERWIDKHVKKKFNRVPIICRLGFAQQYFSGEATSATNDGEVWVVSGTHKSRMPAILAWLDNDKNRGILKAIEEKMAIIKSLQKDIVNLEDSTDRLTVEMVTGENIKAED